MGFRTGEMTRRLFGHPASDDAVAGRIRQRELLRTLAASWGITQRTLGELIDGFWAAHARNEALLRRLAVVREQCRLVVLSNMWPSWRAVMYDRYQLADHFDRFYVSASIGLVKPQPQVYRYVMTREAIADPRDLLLLDDLTPNTRSLERLGGRAIAFVDNASALPQLDRWLRADG